MAVETKLATGYWMRKLILTLLFLVFGIWAVYDGWYEWPRQKSAWEEYEQFEALEEKRLNSPNESLFGDERTTWQSLRDKYKTPPRERTQMDINFQRYILVPLCFPITALLVVTWVMSARRQYRFDEDGSLTAPEGTFTSEEMTGIDMSRWMSKSIAMLEIEGGLKKGGSAVKLDAWIYDGTEEIIETLNRRFHPEEYTEDEPSPPSTQPDGAGEDDVAISVDDAPEQRASSDVIEVEDEDDECEDEVESTS